MDLKALTITKRGSKIEGEPKPGIYYSINAPQGADLKALRAELKKFFPKSQFNIRFAAAAKSEVGTRNAEVKAEGKK